MSASTLDRALKAFAKEAGVTILECGKEWGGTVAYKERDHPNSTVCGFKSEHEAYVKWLEGSFGDHAARAILLLLSEADDAASLRKKYAALCMKYGVEID